MPIYRLTEDDTMIVVDDYDEESALSSLSDSDDERFQVPAVFLDPAGDLVLESSDGHHFRIFRGLLIFGSTFFRSMFTHPQPQTGGQDEPLKWDEPGRIISLILYQLHPIPKPPVEDWQELVALARAADKWGIESVLTMTETELLKPAVFDVRPFIVYSLARDIGSAEFRETVTRRLIAQHDPLSPDIRAGLEDMTALELCKLVDLRKARVEKAQKMAKKSFPLHCRSHGASWLNCETHKKVEMEKVVEAASQWLVLPKGTPFTDDLNNVLKQTKNGKHVICEAGCSLKLKDTLDRMANKFEG